MEDIFGKLEERRKWLESLPDGVPCDHRGCLSHISHPCESCGRIGGKRLTKRVPDASPCTCMAQQTYKGFAQVTQAVGRLSLKKGNSMAKKMKSEDMWAVWNDDFGFYVDIRLSRQEMIDKHTSDLGMTWDECKKTGDKVIRVVITAAQPRVQSDADWTCKKCGFENHGSWPECGECQSLRS